MERTFAPPFLIPGEVAANWWLRPPFTTAGWLLTGSEERAGLAVHEEYKRQLEPDIPPAAWFQQICVQALPDIQGSSSTQAFQHAQEQVSNLLEELTKSLLNVLHHIRFHQEKVTLLSKS